MNGNRKLIVAVAAAVGVAVPPPVLGQPAPEPVFQHEYAVKIACGALRPPGGALVGGSYATAVNIHNPGAPQAFARKIALAFPGAAGRVSPFKLASLKKDEAMEVDCRQMSLQLQDHQIAVPNFFTGFLVIQSFQPFDVVAVYTAAPLSTNEVASIHTERVPGRRM